MKSGRIVVITGSPGTGKTTVSAIVADESTLERSVRLHTDDFYHGLCKGAIPPHLPESNEQNQIVIEAFLEAAKRYARGGYDVIVDGIVGPWFLEPWRKAVREGYEVHYIVLRASKEETLRRAIARDKLNRKTNIELVEAMWDSLRIWGSMRQTSSTPPAALPRRRPTGFRKLWLRGAVGFILWRKTASSCLLTSTDSIQPGREKSKSSSACWPKRSGGSSRARERRIDCAGQNGRKRRKSRCRKF